VVKLTGDHTRVAVNQGVLDRLKEEIEIPGHITDADIELIADPNVSGAYAVRIQNYYEDEGEAMTGIFYDTNHHEMIDRKERDPDSEIGLTDFEEAEFSSWPPRAR